MGKRGGMKSLAVEPTREWSVWIREPGGEVKKGWRAPKSFVGAMGPLQRGCTCGIGRHRLEVGSKCGFCGAVVGRVRCEESTGGVKEWELDPARMTAEAALRANPRGRGGSMNATVDLDTEAGNA